MKEEEKETKSSQGHTANDNLSLIGPSGRPEQPSSSSKYLRKAMTACGPTGDQQRCLVPRRRQFAGIGDVVGNKMCLTCDCLQISAIHYDAL